MFTSLLAIVSAQIQEEIFNVIKQTYIICHRNLGKSYKVKSKHLHFFAHLKSDIFTYYKLLTI